MAENCSEWRVRKHQEGCEILSLLSTGEAEESQNSQQNYLDSNLRHKYLCLVSCDDVNIMQHCSKALYMRDFTGWTQFARESSKS